MQKEKRRGIIEFSREVLEDGVWYYFKQAGCVKIDEQQVFDKDCVLIKFDHPKLPVVSEGANIRNYTDDVYLGRGQGRISVAIVPYFEVIMDEREKPKPEPVEKLQQWVWNR